MNSHTIELADLPRWSANSRTHHHERAKMVRAWRQASAKVADGLPAMTKVEVELLMVPADRRRRDPDNLAGALKPCIDGLVDAGVLPDDSSDYVQAVTLRIAQPQPKLPAHRWLLTVVDVSDLSEVAVDA